MAGESQFWELGLPDADLTPDNQGAQFWELGLPFPGTEGSSTPELDPSGIPSAEALGTPVVAGPITVPGIASAEALGALAVEQLSTLFPSGIPTGQAMGTPTVTGPQGLFPTGIPAGGIGVPTIAGPITVPGIPSAEALGALKVLLQQRVDLGGFGIPSAEALGSHTVAHSQSIIITAGIASAEDLGTPKVQGGAQIISTPVGIYQGGCGNPSVSGGVQAIQWFIGNYDLTHFLRWATPDVKYQTIGRSSCSFDLYIDDGSFAPSLGMLVLGSEKNRKLFAGCIVEITAQRYMSTESSIIYHCKATDKASICDHRVVTDVTFDADEDAADAIRYVVTNFLNGEGVTADGVPPQLGPLGAPLRLNLVTVTQAFDQFADLTAAQWWFDLNGALFFQSLLTAPPAPFSITETSRNWRNLSVTASLGDYVNKVYGKSNLNLLPGSAAAPDPGGPKRTEGYTIPQAYQVMQAFTTGSGLLEFPIVAVVELRVDGVVKTVQNAITPNADLTGTWFFFPGFPYLYAPIMGPDVPTNGQVLSIDYIPVANNAGVAAGDPLIPTPASGILVPPGMRYGTCGSGIFEYVENLPDVQYQDDMDAIVASIQARRSGVPAVVAFETDVPGAMPGQQLDAFIPNMFLELSGAPIPLYITSVEGQSLGVDLGSDCSFRWQISASTIRDPGDWVKYYERIILRTRMALPINQYERAAFVLSPGYSVTSANADTNPWPAGHTGKLLRFEILTDNPSTDEDLLIDITIDGVSIFPAGMPAVLLAGATSALVTVFRIDPLYVQQFQVVRVGDVSYRVTGPNPTPAASVTAALFWTF